MKRKLVCGLLATTMVLSMSAAPAFAQNSNPSSSVIYDNDNNGTDDSFDEVNGQSFDFDVDYTVTKDAGIDDGSTDYYVTVAYSTTTGNATSNGDYYHWDASAMKYVKTKVKNNLTSNTPATADITISNRSNAKVDYAIDYATVAGQDTTEEETTTVGKTGTIESYTKDFTNVEGTISQTNPTGADEYDRSGGTVPSVNYKGKVTLNTQATAVTNEKKGTYTVTIKACASEAKRQTVDNTVDPNGAVTLSSTMNPALDETTGTKVEFPNGTFAANQNARLTVVATPTLAASRFNVTGANNTAVGAVDLTLKVDNVKTTDFNGKAATVTTYIAKGITDFKLIYGNEVFTNVTNKSDVDAANEAFYDSTTGELVFMTDHFSTFVVEGSNQAYIVDNNTAYTDLKAALGSISDNYTVTMLKDSVVSDKITTSKNFTLDLNEKTIKDDVSSDRFLYITKGNVTIKNGDIKVENESTYGFVKITGANGNVTLNVTDVNMSGNTNNGAFIKVATDNSNSAAVYLNLKNIDVDTNCYFEDGTTQGTTQITVEDCTVNCGNRAFLLNAYTYDSVATFSNVTATTDEGPIIEVDGGEATFNNCTFEVKNQRLSKKWYSVTIGASYNAVVNINGGTYTSLKNDALSIYTHGATFNINNGTFNGHINAIKTYAETDSNVNINIYGGSFTGALELPDITVEGPQKNISIKGGTFTTDPSSYLANGYTASESSGTWTVSQSAAE